RLLETGRVKMAVKIQLAGPPNQSPIKYVGDQPLLPSGAANFTSREAARGRSPLAERLMEIEGVTGVMIGSNFVTITKGAGGDWDSLNDSVMSALDEHLSAGSPVVTGDYRPPAKDGEPGIERRIRQILEDEIRP